MLKKLRGLWRFDGDEEPVQVSRRTFLFLGGVAAAGVLVPPALVSPVEAFLARHPNPLPRLCNADSVAVYLEKARAAGFIPKLYNAQSGLCELMLDEDGALVPGRYE